MIIATGFVVIAGLFIYYNQFFIAANVPGILDLEFANRSTGKTMLSAWQDAGLLSLARNLTLLDFAFIFFYVAVIITLSNRQVRKEPSIGLNALLRANFFFAVLAGLLDLVENIFLLYDMSNVNSSSYISSCWIASLKFILVGWTVLVWLISFVKSRLE